MNVASQLELSRDELTGIEWSRLAEAVAAGLESLGVRESSCRTASQQARQHEDLDVKAATIHHEKSPVSRTVKKRGSIPAKVKEIHEMSSSTRTRSAGSRAGKDAAFHAQFASLIENLPVAQFLTESDGSVVVINKAARRLFNGLASRTGFNADALEAASIDLVTEAFPTLKAIALNGGTQQIELDKEFYAVNVTVNSSDNSAIHTWNVLTEHVEDMSKLSEFSHLKSMLENMPTNVILADRNLVITYMNPASLRQLRTLQDVLPVPVDQIVGTSIDAFHRNPAHQRKMLSNPANLPHRAKINVGSEVLDLLVTAVTNEDKGGLCWPDGYLGSDHR